MTAWQSLVEVIVEAGKASEIMRSDRDTHEIIRALDPIWERIKHIVQHEHDTFH